MHVSGRVFHGKIWFYKNKLIKVKLTTIRNIRELTFQAVALCKRRYRNNVGCWSDLWRSFAIGEIIVAWMHKLIN